MAIPKRPRQYAQDICELPTREQRRQALAEAPEHLRVMVESHVTKAFNDWKQQSGDASTDTAAGRGGTR